MALSQDQQDFAVQMINYYSEGAHPEATETTLPFFPRAMIKACLEAAIADPHLKAKYRAYAEAIIEDLGDVAPLEAEEEEWDEFADGDPDYDWGDDLGDFVCEKEFEPH